MNIPYAAFYKAETTGNDTKVDAFTDVYKRQIPQHWMLCYDAEPESSGASWKTD